MRHISIEGKTPPEKWLNKADALMALLEGAPDKPSRDKIIDDNSKLWGELKNWLLSLSDQKCWFSEAKDCFSHWDVEHYRPKKSVKDEDGTEHDGYWWLAFNWKNFRICGNVGNRKKGGYFPLRDTSSRSLAGADTRTEEPLLLDPVDQDDPNLVFFNVEGDIVPVPGADCWEKKRVSYSVERCKLDFGPLKDKRKVVWNECWERVEEYRRELNLYSTDPSNMIAKNQYKEAAKHVRKMVKPESEFSAVARACICSTGDMRLTALLQ